MRLGREGAGGQKKATCIPFLKSTSQTSKQKLVQLCINVFNALIMPQ